MDKKTKKELLKLLQEEGDKSPKTFGAHSYEEGYWNGLKFAAFLINEYEAK